MKKAKKLSQNERDRIAILFNEEKRKLREIARTIGRVVSTISYEIKKNSTNGIYDSTKAHRKARLSKRKGKHGYRKIEKFPKLKKYIIEKLKLGWNPDEISGRMKLDKEPFYVSKSGIYEWLRTSRGERYCKHLYSKRKRVKKRKPKTKRKIIPNRVGIELRNNGANNRSRYGHWEDDAVVSGRNGSGSLSVSYERKARLVCITKCKSMSPKEHLKAHKKIIGVYKVLSKTFDNGIENIYHEQLHAFNIYTFFCDPYSSWQKGGVENANKMIRRYLPKGTDISKISEKEIQCIENSINKKPRKILGYRTALEIAESAGIIC